jgi:hypothetical protein
MPLQNAQAEASKLHRPASTGAAGAAHEDHAHRPSRRRLEQLATIWARQTGRKIVVG